MARYASSVMYAWFLPGLAGESLTSDSFPEFVFLPGNLTYPLLPCYWPFRSLLNQSEGKRLRQVRENRDPSSYSVHKDDPKMKVLAREKEGSWTGPSCDA